MARCAIAILAMLAAAGPFWETRSPREWTDDEIAELLDRSPWAQRALGPKSGDEGISVRLATARPVREAEAELARRSPKAAQVEDPDEGEYEEFLRENEGRYIVLAVAWSNAKALEDPGAMREFERTCALKIGRRKYALAGHFPPSPSDPVLRLVFPRAVEAEDKLLRFEIYLPGVSLPFRAAEFRISELAYKGKLEM